MNNKMNLLHLLPIFAILIFLTVFPCGALSDDSRIGTDLVFVQVPASARPSPSAGGIYLPSSRYVDGCRIVSLSGIGDKEIEVLTSEFVSACDPAVSFDGRYILFAGKRNPGDTWQIWRMDRDGGRKEKLTKAAGHCVSPLYVGSDFHLDDQAPTPQIVYLSTRDNWGLMGSPWPATAIYACKLDGTDARRITFNLFPDFDPDVLPNGRLVYSSWQPDLQVTGLAGKIVLLAINIDGTDLMAYGEETEESLYTEMARVDSNKGVYFIENRHRDWLGGGKLAVLSQRRPLHSRRVLADTSQGFYLSPCPLPQEGVIVSFKARVRDALYGIYLFDPVAGGLKKEIYSTLDYHCLDVQILGPHPVVEGRSSVVGFKYKDSGAIFCLDAYISDLPEIKRIERGTIKRLRVIEGVPLGKPDKGWAFGGFGRTAPGSVRMNAVERILGECPVESDGSFHLRAPANVPLRFQVLNDKGIALAEQVTWTWVRNGEARGCIGCHENRELTPPNVMAEAVAKPEVPLETPVEKRRTVDFIHDVYPIIRDKCMKCHSPAVDKPDMRQEDRVYLSMFKGDRPFAVIARAGRSPLVRRVLKETLTDDGEMTPCAKAATDDDRKALMEWIDLGCWYNSRKALNPGPTATGGQGGN